MNLENIGKDCPCYEVDCSDIMFDIGEFCGLPPNNGKLTIQVNGSTVGDFSANQQEDETINITTPTSQDSADAVAGEALLRQQADNTLQANIDAEELARQRADREIQAVLDEESLARVNGDKNLQSQIDAIASSDLPTVNNGTLTIQKNGTNVATFSANTASNTTANISVPTKTSQITNDSDFITSSDLPTVNNATLTIQKNTTTIDTFTANSATNKTVNITVPTDTGDLTNNAGFLTANDIYPVNSIRILADTADHSTDFGQTWVRYGAGRVLVGYDTSQTEFNTIGKTGGEKTHTLSTNEIPSHSHTIRSGWSDSSPDSDAYRYQFWGKNDLSWKGGNLGTGPTGGGGAHNNLQPYIVVNFWRRTA